MKIPFRILPAWLGLLLACFVPISCLVESEGEIRVLAIDLGHFPVDSGFLVVFLTDTADVRIDDLYAGSVPVERKFRVSAPHYDGGEAILVLQEYIHPRELGGDTVLSAATLIREYRARVRQGDTSRLYPSLELPLPHRPHPGDSADYVGLDTDLKWLLGSMPAPGPRARVHFGTSNPPPLVQSSLADSVLFLGGALQPDKEYFWQVTSVRGAASRPGPVWRFRTRPEPPASLAYPDCDPGCHLGRPMHLDPRYAGGGRISFRVDPPLPAGLILDTLTGVISGIPGAYADSNGYIVTVSNFSGSVPYRLHPDIQPRLIEVAFEEPLAAGHRLQVTLWDADGRFIDTLWAGGRPADGVIRKAVRGYDGEEAIVLLQVLRDSLLTWEKRLLIWQSRDIKDALPAAALDAPMLLSPADNASDLDTLVDLAWASGTDLQPPPRMELRFGLTNPPDLVDSNRTGPARLRVLPDTGYFWQVVNVRAGARSASPVRRFRTRLLPPASLGYPGANEVYHVGGNHTLDPEYVGGGRVRYSSQPPLPEGFSLDSVTGSVRVQPTVETGPAEYVIRAENAAGAIGATLRFQVKSRLFNLYIPDSLKGGDSLSIVLADPSGAFLASIWDAPPPALKSLNWSRGHDDGLETHIIYRSFLNGELLLETRYRILIGKLEPLPPVVPGAPSLPSPASGAADQDTLLELSWAQDSLPGPRPLWRLSLGFTDPPPLWRDSLRDPRAALPPLLPDTLYRWSVAALRAGQEATGPVWSFRTRPAPPKHLSYPADSVLHLGAPVALVPAYAGGTRARYRVEPALPAGLALDPLTGRLSGTPAVTAPIATYAVTAENVSGSARAEVRLGVDWRRVQVLLPEGARAADSAVARLLDPQGNVLDTLWDGPLPADLRVGAATPRYDGVEAGLLVLGFRGGVLAREYRYAVRGPLGLPEAQPLGDLPAPVNLGPQDTVAAADTVLDFSWRSDVSDPPPLSRLYLGTSLPPPLFADSLRGEVFASAALRSDTRYYWRVETLRAGRSVTGPLGGFRTRPPAPQELAYPVADTLIPQDREFSFAPAWRGAGVHFKIDPGLPQGWDFDPATGRISGVAVELADLQEFTVTLSNVSGSRSTNIRLGVDHRKLDFALPDTVLQFDSLSVNLMHIDWGYSLASLWEGPPPAALRIHTTVPYYDGLAAKVSIQGYRKGILVWEGLRRIDPSQKIFELMPLPPLQNPETWFPADLESVDQQEVTLQWYQDWNVTPQPLYRLYFGTTNPPPLVMDSIAGTSSPPLPTLPETIYFWRIEAIRASQSALGEIQSFLSHYPRPQSLEYPGADSTYAIGAPMRIEPVYDGRSGVRFQAYPALPPGVNIDPVTGVISGAPNGPAPRIGYTVSAGQGWNAPRDTLRFLVPDNGDTAARLVARWDLEERGDGLVADSSGGGFHGATNATQWTDGVQGRGMAFHGDTRATFPVRDALEVSGFTVSFWFRPEREDSVQILVEYSMPGMPAGLGCQYNTTGWGIITPGAVVCNLRPSDASPDQHGDERERNFIVTEEGAAPVGRWNHVAYTFDPRTWAASIYVNGLLRVSRVLRPDFTPLSKGRVAFGMRPDDTVDGPIPWGFTGSMDKVEIFSGPLGAGKILEMYEALAP